MRVISLHDQQADEVPWEADSIDRVMRDGRSGCSSERKRKVGKRGLRHRRTSAMMGLNRDKTILICRLSSGEDFVCERKNLSAMLLLIPAVLFTYFVLWCEICLPSKMMIHNNSI